MFVGAFADSIGVDYSPDGYQAFVKSWVEVSGDEICDDAMRKYLLEFCQVLEIELLDEIKDLMIVKFIFWNNIEPEGFSPSDKKFLTLTIDLGRLLTMDRSGMWDDVDFGLQSYESQYLTYWRPHRHNAGPWKKVLRKFWKR